MRGAGDVSIFLVVVFYHDVDSLYHHVQALRLITKLITEATLEIRLFYCPIKILKVTREYSKQQGSVTLQEEPGVQRVVPASRAHAQPPREDLELCLEQPDLVPELGPGLGHEAGVYARVEAAPGVDAERVTLLGGRAAQHRDQPAVGNSHSGSIYPETYI